MTAWALVFDPWLGSRILARNGLIYYKRTKVPLHTASQLAEIPTRARRLERYFLVGNPAVVMNDEKYFTFTDAEDPSIDGYYTSYRSLCPTDVKYKPKTKFPKKVLVWLAISDAGISDALVIRRSSVSIDQHSYLREFIKKSLMKFINEHHSDGHYIFRLASCNYAKKVVDWMDAAGIKYVPKTANQPNCPQARPIENFWSILASKVYSDGWTAKTYLQLIRRINFCLRNIDSQLVKRLMASVRSKVRQLYTNGPLSERLIN